MIKIRNLNAKDKVISKLEEKILKLKENFISFKEKLRSKYSNSKREKKVWSKIRKIMKNLKTKFAIRRNKWLKI